MSIFHIDVPVWRQIIKFGSLLGLAPFGCLVFLPLKTHLYVVMKLVSIVFERNEGNTDFIFPQRLRGPCD